MTALRNAYNQPPVNQAAVYDRSRGIASSPPGFQTRAEWKRWVDRPRIKGRSLSKCPVTSRRSSGPIRDHWEARGEGARTDLPKAARAGWLTDWDMHLQYGVDSFDSRDVRSRRIEKQEILLTPTASVWRWPSPPPKFSPRISKFLQKHDSDNNDFSRINILHSQLRKVMPTAGPAHQAKRGRLSESSGACTTQITQPDLTQMHELL